MSAKAKSPVELKSPVVKLINRPLLLNGETILAEAGSVLKFNIMSSRDSGLMGDMYVTNFKLAFMITKLDRSSPASPRMQASTRRLDDLLAFEESQSECDYIPLTSIDSITAISTIKQVSKKLKVGKAPSKKYDIIEIICKDLRVVQFKFSHCKDSERTRVINTILVYAFPANITKLFAFDYTRGLQKNRKVASKGRAFHAFRHEKDHELELVRLKAQQAWRVTKVNKDFAMCKTLPELNKVPVSLSDEQLQSISESYIDGRIPTFVWSSRETGSALISSSAPRDDEEGSSGHAKPMIDAIHAACFTNNAKQPVIVDASLMLPSLKELQSSYNQMFEACICHSSRDFWSSDATWLSKIDNSRWLEYVKTALTTATRITNLILMEDTPVIVQEMTGRDYSCLLVSLVQIMTDPYYRTIIGLQSLIQKEWVIKGHPFCERMGLISGTQKPSKSKLSRDNGQNDGEEAPIFLLFLDCVHQLWAQFPSLFGYTEYFLLFLLDSVHTCLFENFLFDSEYDRKKFKSGDLESVWDFLATCIPKTRFQTLFVNPLYNVVENLKDDYSGTNSDVSADFIAQQGSSFGSLSEYRPSGNTLPHRSGKPTKSKGSSLPHSFNFRYQSFGNPNISVINPDASCIRVQLWHKHFLRWSLAPDLCKGSSFDLSMYLQQAELLEEVKYLEDRLEHLKEKLDGLDNQVSDVGSNSSHGSTTVNKWNHGKGDNLAKENYAELLSKFTFCNLIHLE